MDEHHLYEIRDNLENDLYKYGISGKPLNSDGSSPRATEQILLFNRLVGWIRYTGSILLTGISGRKRAEEIEEEYIKEYIKTHGHRPRGNP